MLRALLVWSPCWRLGAVAFSLIIWCSVTRGCPGYLVTPRLRGRCHADGSCCNCLGLSLAAGWAQAVCWEQEVAPCHMTESLMDSFNIP